MSYRLRAFSAKCLFLICLLCSGSVAIAQQLSTLPTTRQSDTGLNKTNTSKWKDEEARITYKKLNSDRVRYIDTGIHTYQRRPFIQPWARDMGNLGSPVNNLLFTAEDRCGPSLGYHVFDVYKFNVDSMNFYNTSRPYSVFTYSLGSKLEQVAGLLHSQNIKPNWNMTVDYRKVNSPGSYKTQRNNHDNVGLSTSYHSLNRHYTLYGAVVYNKNQHDENGGVLNDSDLVNPTYSDHKTITTPYQSAAYSATRSAVTNVQRDFTLLLQHSYTWGVTDTFFDDNDTAAYSYQLTPRFSITHKMELSTEKHSYKDLAPDSASYVSLFNQSFANNGTGYYAVGNDSVFTEQKWVWVDNQVLLNGYIGKEGRQLKFSAGPGIRYDQFISSPVSNINPDSLPNIAYKIGYERKSMANSYLTGQLMKEALLPGQWEYGAAAKFFYAGDYAGNFSFNASVGKQLSRNNGSFVAGMQQQLNSAPYSYTTYENVYVKKSFSFNSESVTALYASLDLSRIRLSGGVRAYLINNYIYMAQTELPAQYTIPFTLPQAWIKKIFKFGNFLLDNELVYQNVSGNTPVNVPALMGRHQFSFERALFGGAIKTVTGIEVRYNTSYAPAGYNAQFNRFFYQNTTNVSNTPELSVFFNFRIKRFRAFIMGDNLQQIFGVKNTILYTGTTVLNYLNTGANYVPVYAAPSAMIRFGFSWAMVN